MSDRDASLDEASNIAFKALKEKPPAKPVDLYLYTFIMGFGLPVDFQAVDEYNKYQWRIAGFHSSTYII